MKVLITTSGIGSRLGNITKYTNKSLVRVGKKPAISYIFENYPKETEFVVTLGHYGSQVKQYVEMAHKDLKVVFVDVDKYEGEGSSLLYSIWCAKKHLNCPFIYHACDSITERFFYSHKVDTNWLGGHPTKGSSHYRTFNASNSRVTRLNDKGEKSADYDYIGVCGIRDYMEFWSHADRLIKTGEGLSDYDVIISMMNDCTCFDSRIYSSWDDIGNMDSLKEARRKVSDQFDILDKDDESIYLLDEMVVKFFHNKKTCADRVSRGKMLYPMTPKILESSDNFYSYEYASGKVLSKTITASKMSELLSWADSSLWSPSRDDGQYTKRCFDFYHGKTKDRVDGFLASNRKTEKEEVINGELVPPVGEMLKMIDFSGLPSPTPKMFHGDFILENILETDNGFVLLDWRQNFGGTTEYGDFHYDLAKLNHNLMVDHDSIHKKLYKCVENDDGVWCRIMVPSINIECRGVLQDYCRRKSVEYGKISTITSLVWLSMCSLHEHPLDKFLYYFGRYNLYKALSTTGGNIA